VKLKLYTLIIFLLLITSLTSGSWPVTCSECGWITEQYRWEKCEWECPTYECNEKGYYWATPVEVERFNKRDTGERGKFSKRDKFRRK